MIDVSSFCFGAALGIVGTQLYDWLTRRYFSKPVEVPEPSKDAVRQWDQCPHCPEHFTRRGMSNHIRKAHPESYRKDGAA